MIDYSSPCKKSVTHTKTSFGYVYNIARNDSLKYIGYALFASRAPGDPIGLVSDFGAVLLYRRLNSRTQHGTSWSSLG
jgi:hypothetical protein